MDLERVRVRVNEWAGKRVEGKEWQNIWKEENKWEDIWNHEKQIDKQTEGEGWRKSNGGMEKQWEKMKGSQQNWQNRIEVKINGRAGKHIQSTLDAWN